MATVSKEDWRKYGHKGYSGSDIISAAKAGKIKDTSKPSDVPPADNTSPESNPFSVKPSAKPEAALNSLFSGEFRNSGSGPFGSFARTGPSIPDNTADMVNRYQSETGAPAPAQNLPLKPAFNSPSFETTERSLQNGWLNSDASAYEYLRQSMDGMTPYEQSQTLEAVQSTNPYDFRTGQPVDVYSRYNQYVGNQDAIKDSLNAPKSKADELTTRQQDEQNFLKDLEEEVRRDGFKTPEAIEAEVNRRFGEALEQQPELLANHNAISNLERDMQLDREYESGKNTTQLRDTSDIMRNSTLSYPEVFAQIQNLTHDPNVDWNGVANDFVRKIHPDWFVGDGKKGQRAVNQLMSYLDGGTDISSYPFIDEFVAYMYENNGGRNLSDVYAATAPAPQPVRQTPLSYVPLR